MKIAFLMHVIVVFSRYLLMSIFLSVKLSSLQLILFIGDVPWLYIHFLRVMCMLLAYQQILSGIFIPKTFIITQQAVFYCVNLQKLDSTNNV